ncbi:hypothetical protein YC2023_096687 [Brassica napus]
MKLRSLSKPRVVWSAGSVFTGKKRFMFSMFLDSEEPPLAKITRNSAKITVEQVHGLMSQVIKDILFSQSDKTPSDPSDPGPMVTS